MENKKWWQYLPRWAQLGLAWPLYILWVIPWRLIGIALVVVTYLTMIVGMRGRRTAYRWLEDALEEI